MQILLQSTALLLYGVYTHAWVKEGVIISEPTWLYNVTALRIHKVHQLFIRLGLNGRQRKNTKFLTFLMLTC